MGISETSYSLIQIELTDEIHIFKGQFMKGNCSLRMYSMCEKVCRLNTRTIMIERCLNDAEIKNTAKIMGATVCEICKNRLEEPYKEYLY
ncbi:MAG: hypothetical protein ACI7YS_11170 [Flavobacterium sp.]